MGTDPERKELDGAGVAVEQCDHGVRYPHPCDDCLNEDIPQGMRLADHPCYGLSFVAPTDFSHRAYLPKDGPIYCKRCGTELDRNKGQKTGAPLSWQPRLSTTTSPEPEPVDELEAVARAIHEADPDVGVSWNEWVAYAELHPYHMQSVDFVRRQARAVLAALTAQRGLTLAKEGVGGVCAARGSVGANDPQDCDYPDCECDPNAKRLDDYGTALNNLNWHLIDVRKALAELSASSEEVMTLLRNASAMQGREHIGVGSRFADAMAAAKIALSPQTAEPLAGGKTEGGA